MTGTDRLVPMGASSEAIQFHYDLSNDFYRLWLDELMVYSCALWEEGDSLDRAQQRKLDYLVTQCGAAGKSRVLDIGCGWGGLLQRMTKVHGVNHGVGLTLSQAQAEYIDGLGLDDVEVRVENWTDHQPDATYDAIISIGAFEHFAKPGLSRRDRVEAYRDFFRACRRWLPAGGGLALQTVTKGDNVRLSRGTMDDMAFIMERIFPESELPWLSEIIEASERRFVLTALRSDAAHYARTTLTWRNRLRERSAQALAMVGQSRVDEYDRYLDSFSREFDALHLNLIRLIFRRM
jgi:cyclopropane-fatty-acyl-phospholipid synthase